MCTATAPSDEDQPDQDLTRAAQARGSEAAHGSGVISPTCLSAGRVIEIAPQGDGPHLTLCPITAVHRSAMHGRITHAAHFMSDRPKVLGRSTCVVGSWDKTVSPVRERPALAGSTRTRPTRVQILVREQFGPSRVQHRPLDGQVVESVRMQALASVNVACHTLLSKQALRLPPLLPVLRARPGDNRVRSPSK